MLLQFPKLYTFTCTLITNWQMNHIIHNNNNNNDVCLLFTNSTINFVLHKNQFTRILEAMPNSIPCKFPLYDLLDLTSLLTVPARSCTHSQQTCMFYLTGALWSSAWLITIKHVAWKEWISKSITPKFHFSFFKSEKLSRWVKLKLKYKYKYLIVL